MKKLSIQKNHPRSACLPVLGFALTIQLAALPAMGGDESGPGPVQGDASTSEVEVKKPVSVLDAAPSLYSGLIRMPNYYGDPNMDRETLDGSILARQYLFGSLGGLRDRAADHGLILDMDLTQVYQGVVSGDGDGGRYFGSGDVWLGLDSGRAGLWPGGLLISHFEGNWGEVVTGTGGLLPLNADTTMPASPSSLALSELYLFQALPEDFSVMAGKVYWAGIADKSLFANNERTQFLYEGLVNNAILGAFVPYTALGAAVSKKITPELGLTAVGFSNDSSADRPAFDTFDFGAFTCALTAEWTPTFGGLPGNYNIIFGYSSKDITSYDIDDEYLLGEIIGTVPVAQESENYAMVMAGSQYLWVDKTGRRSDGRPVGFGPFFRFGIAPEDRNLIDQFYSAGLGGNGGPFRRHNDSWGIGWAGSHISSDFRRDAGVLGVDVGDFEHVWEAYYQVAITPAVHASFHAQYLNSAKPSADDAVILATRLQVNF